LWVVMEDSELTTRPARDVDVTFEALVRAHVDHCHAIALRILGNHADAEEAAQDAFVRAYRALASFKPERIGALRLRPWLATIVVNGCRNRLRRRPVAALPQRYRIPVVLRHVGDLSCPELAEVLGRPEGTLKAQVHRGLAMLRAAADHQEQTR
jgi:RNA polymerase sigma-70 factor (ECF subfamily)